jgi:hypothetical protein
MHLLAYKPNAPEITARLRDLYERRSGDRVFARMHVPSKALDRFRREHVSGPCDYPDPAERIAFWDGLLAEGAAVEDDAIPSAYLTEMDQGLYGGLVDGEVRFQCDTGNGWISSMVVPLWKDWSRFDSLRFDPGHPWFERYARQLDLFVARAKGRFGVSHFILIDALNFAFELVGATETYMSLETQPEVVRKAIDFAFTLNTAVQDHFFRRVSLVDGGTSSNMVSWVPGRIVSESIDPYHMTSVAYFERWGREPVERILGRYDGGVLHIHGNGRHLVEAACSIRGAKAIMMGDDKGFPAAFDIVDQLRARAGDMPLSVRAEFGAFVERLDRHELPGGILYEVQNVPEVESANRCMEKVRAYRV